MINDPDGSIIKYDDNGVKIVASPLDFCYDIFTNKYTIVWYVSPTDELNIFHKDESGKFWYKKQFDMSYLAKVEDNSVNPGKLSIIYSSAEFVNHQIDRILNLKVFL